VTTLWDSLSPLRLTHTAGLAEEVSEDGFARATGSQFASACEEEGTAVSIPAGFHSVISSTATNDETPETDSAPGEGIGIGMGMLYPVSVFAPELSGWLSVLSLTLGSSDDDRSLAPFFPLSPLLFLLSDAAFHPKEGSLVCLSSSLARE
jgi:hypothetical protein